MNTLIQDLRYGARSLRKNPGFTLVAVATLALGIGANTAIFSVVHGVLLKSLPFPDADRIVTITEDNPSEGFLGWSASPPNFLDWKSQNRSFSSLAALTPQDDALTGAGQPEQVKYAATTSEFFSVLGVHPILGREYSPSESQDGKDHVAILSYGLWQRRFGGRRDIVGSAFRLGGESYSVIGVMPAGFEYPARRHDLWVPLNFGTHVTTQRGAHYLTVIGRLTRGVAPEAAQADLKAIAARLEAAYPSTNKGYTVSLRSLKEQMVGKVKPALLVLMGAVGLVVLIACANVANLLLARAAGRERELAVRAALGASRGRIVRQLLAEAVLLAFCGTAAALLLATIANRAIVAYGPADMPRMADIRLDPAVLGGTIALAFAAAVLFGLLPAIRASRAAISGTLREGRSGGGPASERIRAVLVAGEMALALLLLSGAGLLVKSFSRMLRVDPGFQADHVLKFDLSLDAKYPDTASISRFYEQLLGRLNTLPGVRAAGAVFCAPLSDSKFSSSFTVRDQPAPPEGREPHLQLRVVSADYFQTMRIPLVSGRTFSDRDRRGGERVMLLTQAAARKYFPSGNAIGQYLLLGARPSKDDVEGRVVGIVGNTHDSALAEDPNPAAYVPLDQVGVSGLTIVIRTAQRPETVAAATRQVVSSLDRDLPVVDMTTMESVVASSVAKPRFYAFLLSIFSAAALALAAVGVFGVLSFAVAQRTRDIGIRIAVGAVRSSVMAMVLGRAARLAAVGLAAGLALSLLATRMLSGILFGIDANDFATLAEVSSVLFAVAMLASYIPARRATRIDPMVALRSE